MVKAPSPRVALVTGGARRIGAAICQDLADHGWSVAIHYNRSQEEAEDLAERIRRSGGGARSVGCDLGDPSQLPGLIPQVAEALGPPTLLVNNAATFARDEIGELDRSAWEAQLAVNLAAPVFLTEALAGQLADGVQGNVVNILDQRVLKPLPVYVSYQLSKSALHTATRTLAQALAPRVRVHGIAPGPTLAHTHQTTERFDQITRSVPLQRGAELAEFGRAVRFFVDNASITGQTVALDGGQHLAWETIDQQVID